MDYELRPWKLTDAKSLAKHANNIHIWDNVRDRFPHPYSEDDAIEFIRFTMESNTVFDFAIVVDSEAVGGVGIVSCTDIERISAEVGYWIGEEFWGRGIVTSALVQVVNYAFNTLSLVRLFAGVFEFNEASMRVLEKVGFKKESVIRKAAIKNGHIIDLHYYSLIKENL